MDPPVSRLRLQGPQGDQLRGPLLFQAFRDGGKETIILLIGKQLLWLFRTFHNFNLSNLKKGDKPFTFVIGNGAITISDRITGITRSVILIYSTRKSQAFL
jgi:hypothetical protein